MATNTARGEPSARLFATQALPNKMDLQHDTTSTNVGDKRKYIDLGSTDEDEPPEKPAAAKVAKPAADAASASNVAAAVIVFAPGAGGRTARDMVSMHQKLATWHNIQVVRCGAGAPGQESVNWNNINPGMNNNLNEIVAACTTADTAHPGAPIFLCGASFGCRVLAEVLRTGTGSLPSAVRTNTLICCGYPLIAKDKQPPCANATQRANHLIRLPNTVHTLFVQGTDDEFLGFPTKDMNNLRNIMQQMTGPTTLHEVPRGEHTVPKAKGGRAAAEAAERAIVDRIASFIQQRL